MAKKSPVKVKIVKQLNHIVFVLDRSSSMSDHRNGVLDVMKRQFEEHRKRSKDLEMETKVSLFTFSDTVDEPVIYNQDIQDSKGLIDNSYQPNGWTALNDGIATAILQVTDKTDKNVGNLLVVITDGEENKSVEYKDQEKIRSVISEARARGNWSMAFFVPPGHKANVVKDYGISPGDCVEWEATTQKQIYHFSTVMNDVMAHNYYGARSIGIMSCANTVTPTVGETPEATGLSATTTTQPGKIGSDA